MTVIGKLGHGSEENVAIPCMIPSLEDTTVVHISAGCEHSAAITEDGTLLTWGHGDGGRLGQGDNAQCGIPSPVQAIRMMSLRPYDVHCGDKFTVVLAKPDQPLESLSVDEHESNELIRHKRSSSNSAESLTASSTDPQAPPTGLDEHPFSELWFRQLVEKATSSPDETLRAGPGPAELESDEGKGETKRPVREGS